MPPSTLPDESDLALTFRRDFVLVKHTIFSYARNGRAVGLLACGPLLGYKTVFTNRTKLFEKNEEEICKIQNSD